MKYIDRVVIKMFKDSLDIIKNGKTNLLELKDFYETTNDTEYIYNKKFFDEDYYLINATSSGIGVFIKNETFLYVFEKIALNDFEEEISKLARTKKNKKKVVFNSILKEVLIKTIQECNSKEFNFKDDIRISNCTEF